MQRTRVNRRSTAPCTRLWILTILTAWLFSKQISQLCGDDDKLFYCSLKYSLRCSLPVTYSQGTWRNLRRLEVGWEKVACWSTKPAISLKRVKIEEKLLQRAYRNSPTLFRFFGSSPYFYFWFRLYGHRDGRFCLIFACTAQQSVLDGTNGLSSFKPCAYCRIVNCADIFAIAQLSCYLSHCYSIAWDKL